MVERIRTAGADILAISPEREPYLRQMAKKHGLSFEVVRDTGNAYAGQLGLRYRFPDDLKKIYLDFGIDLERFNGDDSWTLPMPARFVVDRNGIIRLADVSPDYTVRPEPDEMFGVLKNIG